MTEPLTESRFIELADAYGGVIARWPAEHRAGAMEMAKLPRMRAALAEAEALDSRLDLWVVEAPSPGLVARIVAARRVPMSRRARLWWSGIGVATALAGVAAGSVAVAAVMPVDRALSDQATVFGDLGQEN